MYLVYFVALRQSDAHRTLVRLVTFLALRVSKAPQALDSVTPNYYGNSENYKSCKAKKS